jgi:predicted  nucleic acid-binding Zn-ribbon protein
MSFKKNPTVEELKEEVEALQGQVVTLNAKLNAANKTLKNHPAQIELDGLKAKWWYKLITGSW